LQVKQALQELDVGGSLACLRYHQGQGAFLVTSLLSAFFRDIAENYLLQGVLSFFPQSGCCMVDTYMYE
jgi:hypothetical protein